MPRGHGLFAVIGLISSCERTPEVTSERHERHEEREGSATVEPAAAPHPSDTASAHAMGHGVQFVDAARSIGPSIVSLRAPEPRVIGSGVVFDTHGHILTNNHILEGAASTRVRFQDGREAEASLVGRDPKANLALVRVTDSAAKLHPAPLGDSDRLQIGEWVLSCGNPGSRLSVSVGVVSGIAPVAADSAGEHRDLIHTDANINAGNSGGPLVDRSGRVVGINTAAAAQSGSASSGLGFAIPINMAKQVAAELIANAKVGRGDISVE